MLTSVAESLVRLSSVSVNFNLVLVVCATSVASTFLPFLSVGSAKVRIFFKLPNKINFIFQALFFFFPLFQYANVI